MQTVNLQPQVDQLQDRVCQLEGDNENLRNRVTCLSDRLYGFERAFRQFLAGEADAQATQRASLCIPNQGESLVHRVDRLKKQVSGIPNTEVRAAAIYLFTKQQELLRENVAGAVDKIQAQLEVYENTQPEDIGRIILLQKSAIQHFANQAAEPLSKKKTRHVAKIG